MLYKISGETEDNEEGEKNDPNNGDVSTNRKNM